MKAIENKKLIWVRALDSNLEVGDELNQLINLDNVLYMEQSVIIKNKDYHSWEIHFVNNSSKIFDLGDFEEVLDKVYSYNHSAEEVD